MKLSRSEFLVLKKVMESKEKGLSYNELLRTLVGELSNQGLSDALKSLQLKNLLRRDFMTRTKGSHAMYKTTVVSLEALYTHDVADFIVSKDVVMQHIPTPVQAFESSCFYPSVTMIRQPGEAFEVPEENENFGKRLWDAAQHMVSVWLTYRQKHYNENSIKVIREYEVAFARYLWLFSCQTKKWAPGADNTHLKGGPYNYVDPLELVQRKGNLDWPLKKYRITEEELKLRHNNFPQDDELGRVSIVGLRKLKAVVYNKEMREMYEVYLRSLIPPKAVVLIDFGVSTSLWVAEKGQDESQEDVEAYP
jgi:hypothetical protein